MSYRPTPPSPTKRSGTCQKVIGGQPTLPVMGGTPPALVKCGKLFTGSPARKYCDEHSANVKYRGKG